MANQRRWVPPGDVEARSASVRLQPGREDLLVQQRHQGVPEGQNAVPGPEMPAAGRSALAAAAVISRATLGPYAVQEQPARCPTHPQRRRQEGSQAPVERQATADPVAGLSLRLRLRTGPSLSRLHLRPARAMLLLSARAPVRDGGAVT